jgi:hypothetical protein
MPPPDIPEGQTPTALRADLDKLRADLTATDTKVTDLLSRINDLASAVQSLKVGVADLRKANHAHTGQKPPRNVGALIGIAVSVLAAIALVFIYVQVRT